MSSRGLSKLIQRIYNLLHQFKVQCRKRCQIITAGKNCAFAEILAAMSAGKIASLIGMESGHALDSKMGALRMFYDLGVRYMTLTHSCNAPWYTE